MNKKQKWLGNFINEKVIKNLRLSVDVLGATNELVRCFMLIQIKMNSDYWLSKNSKNQLVKFT